MTLADFTNPALIIPRLQSTDVAGVINELSQALQREGRISDLLPFYHAALNREYLVSTNTEAGMAFPHARIASLKQVSFALGRSQQSLAWGSKSQSSVRLVFLLAVPATDSTQYLPLISGLVRLAKDQALVDHMLTERNPEQLFEALQQVELRIRTNGHNARSIPAI
jgi:fructose PTS system EIIBC or EIIC component